MLSLAAALALTVAATQTATAHWLYSKECCNDRDCFPLPKDSVKATDTGYLYVPTGEVVPFADPRVKHSPDGSFHGCIIPWEQNRLRCLYVPDQGA